MTVGGWWGVAMIGGGGDGKGVVMMVLGVVKGFGLLRILILGIAAFGFLIYDVMTFASQFGSS